VTGVCLACAIAGGIQAARLMANASASDAHRDILLMILLHMSDDLRVGMFVVIGLHLLR